MKKEVQSEFFTQEIDKKIRKIYYPSIRKLFPYGFVSIRLSYEGFIFSLIVFILICTIFFSLGVERGKKYVYREHKDTISSGYLPKYTIQIAAYKDKKQAMKIVRELMQNGYKPFIIYSRGIYQICIGEYPDKELAREDLFNIIKKYKDSYIRSIPQKEVGQ